MLAVFEMHADHRERVRGLSLLLPLIRNDSLASFFFFFFLLEPFTLAGSASVHLMEEVGKRSPTFSSLFPFSSPCFSPLLALHLSSCLFDLLPARRRDNILDEPNADKLMPAAAL